MHVPVQFVPELEYALKMKSMTGITPQFHGGAGKVSAASHETAANSAKGVARWSCITIVHWMDAEQLFGHRS